MSKTSVESIEKDLEKGIAIIKDLFETLHKEENEFHSLQSRGGLVTGHIRKLMDLYKIPSYKRKAFETTVLSAASTYSEVNQFTFHKASKTEMVEFAKNYVYPYAVDGFPPSLVDDSDYYEYRDTLEEAIRISYNRHINLRLATMIENNDGDLKKALGCFRGEVDKEIDEIFSCLEDEYHKHFEGIYNQKTFLNDFIANSENFEFHGSVIPGLSKDETEIRIRFCVQLVLPEYLYGRDAACREIALVRIPDENYRKDRFIIKDREKINDIDWAYLRTSLFEGQFKLIKFERDEKDNNLFHIKSCDV